MAKKLRAIRFDDDLWLRGHRLAHARGTTLSALVRELLEAALKKQKSLDSLKLSG